MRVIDKEVEDGKTAWQEIWGGLVLTATNGWPQWERGEHRRSLQGKQKRQWSDPTPPHKGPGEEGHWKNL